MSDASPHSIVWRMEDCLTRMQMHFQQLVTQHADALTVIEAGSEQAEEVLAQLESVAFNPQLLGKEYTILKREWDSIEDIAEADRNRMRALGESVQALSAQLQQSYEALGAHAQSEAHSIQDELNEMKRMGNVMDKYRPGDDEDRRGFDSQA